MSETELLCLMAASIYAGLLKYTDESVLLREDTLELMRRVAVAQAAILRQSVLDTAKEAKKI